MKAYKLVRLKKDGKIGSLFINRKFNMPMCEWVEAKDHPNKNFKHRVGWHCTLKPEAPHLKMVLANGERRVWVEVEVDDYTLLERCESQGGTWVLANKMKVIGVLDND